jgi:alpha-mannosidase
VSLALLALTCTLQVASAQPASRPISKAPQVERIIVVFKTHFDIGYTDMAVNVVQRYRTKMVDKALALVDQTRDLPAERQFAWTLPGWPMKMILEDWPGQSPERKQRIQAACKEGRFVIHALPFTTHTELLEPEDLVRGMNFSSRLSREMNLALPRDAKMTDVPSHSSILPTLLKHAGVEFMHIGCNSASSSPEIPMLFWWEGPDGSRVLTMYAAGGYGTGHVPPKDWPHRTWLALIHTGDNHGPPTSEEVGKLFEQIKKDMPQAEVHIGRLSDFSDAILAEKPELPVVRTDMPDTWIHGPMSDPVGVKIARNIRPAMAATEGLDTNLRNWGVEAPDATATIATAYENSLLYGEHTWGGSLAWITPYSGNVKYLYGDAWKKARAEGRYDRSESSWREHTAYIEKARDLIQPLLESDMQALARAVSVDGSRIVVYNPLATNRSGYVSMPGGDRRFGAVKSVPDGEILPVEISGEHLGFVARDVPAMGYRTYVPVKADPGPAKLVADENTAALEGPFFKIAIDSPKGVIRSLVDKRTGRELVDTAAPHGFGQFLYERFDKRQVTAFHGAYVKTNSDWAKCEFGKPNLPSAEEAPYRATSPDGFTLHCERTPVAVRAILESKAAATVPCGVTTTITLYSELPYVDLEVTLHDKPADPWPEAGWICLPYKVDSPRFQLARVGSIIDPAKDIVAGANRHLLALNGGMSVVDRQGFAAGLCPIDHPLVSLAMPGCWKFSKDFVPVQSWVYVNLFNNQWTTNFRFWNEGTWSSRVRLWANGKYEPASGLIVPSEEARHPLLAAWTDAKPGPLAATKRGLRVCREGALVTAFGANPDGGGTILRLWEQAGQSGPCRIQLPDDMRIDSVQSVTLRGEPIGKPLTIRDGVFEVALKGYAPTSLQLIAR